MKNILIAFFLALGLGFLWLVQDNLPFVQLRPKHYSISEIEAQGLGLKFSNERTTADGKTRVWTFKWEIPGPLPLEVGIHANPTQDELNAAEAAALREALFLADQRQDTAGNAIPNPTPRKHRGNQ